MLPLYPTANKPLTQQPISKVLQKKLILSQNSIFLSPSPFQTFQTPITPTGSRRYCTIIHESSVSLMRPSTPTEPHPSGPGSAGTPFKCQGPAIEDREGGSILFPGALPRRRGFSRSITSLAPSRS